MKLWRRLALNTKGMLISSIIMIHPSLIAIPPATPSSRALSCREYLPELQRARESREKSLNAMKEDSLSRFMKDLAVDREQNPAAAQADKWDPTAGEENDDDDDDLDVNIIDRSTSPSLPPFVPSYLLVFLPTPCPIDI